MIDSLKFRHEEKAAIRRIKKNVSVKRTVALRIDAKTVIFIHKGDDPVKKKEEFILKLEKARNNDKN
jgi:hypothetical protein